MNDCKYHGFYKEGERCPVCEFERNDAVFVSVRTGFRNRICMKDTGELEAILEIFKQFEKLSPLQRELLANDVEVLKSYKATSKSMNEEFQKIENGFYKVF